MLIERYISKEVFFSFLVTLVTLVSIFFMYSLTVFLNEAASGSLSGKEIFALTLLKTFISCGILIPLSYFLAIVMAFGRLNLNNELTALRVGGASSGNINGTIIVLGLLVTALTAATSLHGRQWAYENLYNLKDEIASKWEFGKVRAKRFYLSDNENLAIYIGSSQKESGRITEVFIRNNDGNGLEIITSPRGVIESFRTPKSHRLILNDAKIYKSGTDDNFFTQLKKLTLDIEAFKKIEEKHRVKNEHNLDLALSSSPVEKAEWQWRLAAPVSCVILIATALPLIRITPRQGRLAKIPLAIGIYAVYYIALGFSRTLVEQGNWTNLWAGPIVFTIVLSCYGLSFRIGDRRK